MKRRRKAPAWRCQGEPVLRDVRPGAVPVPIHLDDGRLWRVMDLDARLVAGVETLAKRDRMDFESVIARALQAEMQRWQGFE